VTLVDLMAEALVDTVPDTVTEMKALTLGEEVLDV